MPTRPGARMALFRDQVQVGISGAPLSFETCHTPPLASITMTTSQRAPQGAAFAFETAVRSIDDQLRRIESLDSKAGILLGAGGVLAVLLFSEGSILDDAPTWLGVVIAIASTASILLALAAFTNRKYRSGVSPEAVTRFATRDEDWIKWRLQSNLLESWRWNDGRLSLKAKLVSWSLFLLFVTAVTTGGFFCILLIGG